MVKSRTGVERRARRGNAQTAPDRVRACAKRKRDAWYGQEGQVAAACDQIKTTLVHKREETRLLRKTVVGDAQHKLTGSSRTCPASSCRPHRTHGSAFRASAARSSAPRPSSHRTQSVAKIQNESHCGKQQSVFQTSPRHARSKRPGGQAQEDVQEGQEQR